MFFSGLSVVQALSKLSSNNVRNLEQVDGSKIFKVAVRDELVSLSEIKFSEWVNNPCEPVAESVSITGK